MNTRAGDPVAVTRRCTGGSRRGAGLKTGRAVDVDDQRPTRKNRHAADRPSGRHTASLLQGIDAAPGLPFFSWITVPPSRVSDPAGSTDAREFLGQRSSWPLYALLAQAPQFLR